MATQHWAATLYLDSYLNFYHCSNVLAGLASLSQSGLLDLRIERPGDGKTSYTGSSLVLRIDFIDLATQRTWRTALDLFDRSDRFSLEELGACDRYYKRSFYTPEQAAVPLELRRKLRPLGLNYACRGDLRRPLGTLARDYAIRLTSAAGKGPRTLLNEIKQLQVRGFVLSPRVDDFEWAPSHQAIPKIVFQTRLWADDEVGPGEQAAEMNRSRVGVVQALRKAFPAQFVGGLMPTALAKERYPDLLATEPASRRKFIAWSRSFAVGVYTRGLHHSQAFKLAEYLASSKCIVTDAFRNQLPQPLTEGVNYLEFGTPEQCVEHCKVLLEDPHLSYKMRQANWSYYEANVRPDARLAALLADLEGEGGSGAWAPAPGQSCRSTVNS